MRPVGKLSADEITALEARVTVQHWLALTVVLTTISVLLFIN